MRGIDSDDVIRQSKLVRELDSYTTELAARFSHPPQSKPASRSLVNNILNFVGSEHVIRSHPAYAQGAWFEKVLDATAEHLLSSSTHTADWSSALDMYEGVHSIPLMTIHKSKGLEYHTVIFVGLDDGAWWSFSQDEIEATAGFFVAFTRAKQRVIFTYCASRGTRTKIATLYELLTKAGVQITTGSS